ncbi:MAG TPA: FG-GAP repeat protein [Polyangiaceae bacterium]
MLSRCNLFVALACAASVGACSDLIGADFENRHLRTNRAPLAPDAVLKNVVEGTTGNTLPLSASDPEGEQVTYYLAQPSDRAGIDAETGLFSYGSEYGAWNRDAFKDVFGYRVRDRGGHYADAKVTVLLLPAGPLTLLPWSSPPSPPPPADPRSYFGASVAFDGDRLIVGATHDGAYILRRQPNGTWQDEQKIEPPTEVPQDPPKPDARALGFGLKTALEGDWAVVSAFGRFDGAQSPPGRAYFYKRKGTCTADAGADCAGEALGAYEPVQMVCALSGDCERGVADRFGLDLALEGRFAVIAARDASIIDPDPTKSILSAGAVYVYELDASGEQWNHIATLRAPRPKSGDWFGATVALDGDTLAVGAPGTDTVIGEDNVLEDTGAVYVYERGNWRDPGPSPLMLPFPVIPNLEGFQMGQVALSGDRLVCGAPGAFAQTGRAFLYERVNGNWEVLDTFELLPRPPPLPNGEAKKTSFGLAVAIDGNIAVVTHRHSDYEGGAIMYRRESLQPGPRLLWTPRRSLVSSRNYSAGWAAAVKESAVVVGAPHGGSKGHVYAFHVPPIQDVEILPSPVPE